MADETTAVSPEGQEAAQPDDTALEDYEFADDNEGDAAPQDAVIPEVIVVEPPVTVEQPTPVELMQQAEERAFQRMASWSGRRDKELLDAVSNLINQRLPPQMQQQVTPADAASILDNPDAWVAQRIQQLAPQVLHNEINRVTAAERNYTASLIQHVGQVMDADPEYVDKKLGEEVITEFQKNFGNLNKNLPPDVGGELLLAKAYKTVMGRRNAQKTNALAGNTGVKGGVGGVKPGGNVVPIKSKPVKLSPDAERLAKRWGYKEEDLQRVFKDT